MLAASLRRICVRTVAAPKAVRAFSEYSIPKDMEQQTGRRKEELEAELAGDVGFNRDPIIPNDDAGTKENPILVSSSEAHRKFILSEDLFLSGPQLFLSVSDKFAVLYMI